MSDESATAFVPGHVTGFFSAYPATDPVAAGSRGAGLTLTDGVEVIITRGAGRSQDGATQTLNGDPVTIEAVSGVLDRLGLGDKASVAANTDLPIGAGFGVSGAAALGTALAANQLFNCGRTENELVSLAHAAEVDAGTGLGDVVAQARGGVPIRLEPGGPGHGELDGVPATARVEYVTFGELSTTAVLSEDTETLTEAGERALTRLREDPQLPTLMAASRTFAREAELLVPEVAEAIDAVDAAGGEAAMAMLGRTVFALGTGLSDAGYDPAVCQTHNAGSHLLPTDADGDAEAVVDGAEDQQPDEKGRSLEPQ